MANGMFWIAGPWPGRLAILLRPRGGDWLSRDTEMWRRAGLDVVVSLLEPSEARELGLIDEAASASESGLDFRAFPIPDRGVPTHRAAARFASQLVADLRAGKSVGLHCRQGIGRSALVAAATLIVGGVNAAAALNDISASRGLQIPETEEQRRWVLEFVSVTQDVGSA